MAEHKSISIAGQIFERLEHDILIGSYKRGEVLTELKLSETLGVSRTPIREALRRLEQEHLIEETSKGALVLGITEQDIKDIYEIRLNLEGLAAYRAAERITDDELAKMREVLDLQRFYVERPSDSSDKIKDLDSSFHEMLYGFSGSKILLETLLPLHKKLIKYRKASVKSHSRAKLSEQEHEKIYEALANHDPELAKKLTVEHVTKAANSITDKEID